MKQIVFLFIGCILIKKLKKLIKKEKIGLSGLQIEVNRNIKKFRNFQTLHIGT